MALYHGTIKIMWVEHGVESWDDKNNVGGTWR
jgi:hypothetical protein